MRVLKWNRVRIDSLSKIVKPAPMRSCGQAVTGETVRNNVDM